MKLQYFNKMMDAILRQVFLMTVSSLTFQIITAIVKECTSKIMLSKWVTYFDFWIENCQTSCAHFWGSLGAFSWVLVLAFWASG